jgi:alkylhydroperoxidase family enzyme
VKPRIEPVSKSGWDFNVFSTFAVHTALYRDWLSFAAHIMRRNTLPDRDREILALRIAWLCQSEYEWAQHTRIGRTVGLSDEGFRRIIAGRLCSVASDRRILPADRAL